MEIGAPGPIKDGIPPVDAPKPNPKPPGAGSKEVSKADPPTAGTSAGKVGELKAPGPKQGNPENPTAAKPDRDIASLLQRYGTIASGPNKVRDKRGIWNTTWQAIINLHKDPAGRDGLKNPPASFYLGGDEGRIRYPGQPFTCRKCQAVGHKGIDCPEKYCRICRQTGHETNRCTGKKVCNLCGGDGHTYYQCPKSERPRTYAAAAAGTPAQKITRPKLDPTANAKVNALLKASREDAQKIPEPTRRSNPKGQAPQDLKSPGPDPDVEPTTATDPATSLETTVPVVPIHPEGTPENGAQTNTPPLEAQGEPEPTPGTKAEEGKESTAAAGTSTPTSAPVKTKKKTKHLKKKVDSSSGDKEEIEKAWKQVTSQRLREKCRKEKEERDERRWARINGKQPPPRKEPQTEPPKDEEMERDEMVTQPPQKSGRKRQRQRKEDFYTTKKKHITSQTEETNDGYTTIDTDEENIEDTGGTPSEPNQLIQTVLQELHQQLALIDTTGAPKEQAQWTKVPEAEAEIVISDESEEESKGKGDQQESQHSQ
ncbi:hypothetical protein NDU88_008682 [Pleurodeles waltl]|uniref:CCHC-type domain-containing protein n=1 Tax=Pleurodeles waltl TaxID=8319 RepID=A0AAV7QPA2_PLEWA|nr:hypothetical protein NDU88_008682 [Pleurodeles waltl]